MRAKVALLLLACACSEHGSTPGDAGDDGRTTILVTPATPNRDLDLLFMIDDSPTTAAFQQSLRDNFPLFVNVLSALPGGLPNLHLGVITSDMGTSASGSAPGAAIGQIGQGGCAGVGKNGELQVGAAPVTGTFVSDIELTDGSRQRNYTGTLADVFTQMAQVGSGGCGFEQPLRAVQAALDNNPANAGFVRPDALLGVVLLTDEDDCSAKDSSLYSPTADATLGALQSFRCTRFGVTCTTGGQTPDAMNQVGSKTGCGANVGSALLDNPAILASVLTSLKGDLAKIVVAGIAGNTDPVAVELRTPPGGGTAIPALAHSCSFIDTAGQTEVADPAVRIKAFLDLFSGRSSFSTICQQDLSGALGQIGQLVGAAMGSACVPIFLPPEADCVVEDVLGATVTPIIPCDSIDTPTCWRLVFDPSCLVGNQQRLVVVRSVAPPPETFTRLRCKP